VWWHSGTPARSPSAPIWSFTIGSDITFVLGVSITAVWPIQHRVMEPFRMPDHTPGSPVVPNGHAARAFAAYARDRGTAACFILRRVMETLPNAHWGFAQHSLACEAALRYSPDPCRASRGFFDGRADVWEMAPMSEKRFLQQARYNDLIPSCVQMNATWYKGGGNRRPQVFENDGFPSFFKNFGVQRSTPVERNLV